MRLKNILLGACGVVALISLFLPWYTATIFGISASANGFAEGFTAIGVISLLVAGAVIALNAASLKKDLFDKLNIVNTVLGAGLVILGIIAMATAQANSFGLATTGFGVYILMIAGVATIVLTWLKIDNVVGESGKSSSAKK